MVEQILTGTATDLIADLLKAFALSAVAVGPNFLGKAKGKMLTALRVFAAMALIALVSMMASLLAGNDEITRAWAASAIICAIAISISASSVIAHYIGRHHAWNAFGHSMDMHESSAKIQMDASKQSIELLRIVAALQSENKELNRRIGAMERGTSRKPVPPPPPRIR